MNKEIDFQIDYRKSLLLAAICRGDNYYATFNIMR